METGESEKDWKLTSLRELCLAHCLSSPSPDWSGVNEKEEVQPMPANRELSSSFGLQIHAYVIHHQQRCARTLSTTCSFRQQVSLVPGPHCPTNTRLNFSAP
jgi:hypothetical protein